jgi:DNA-binding response OmpR family regulator
MDAMSPETLAIVAIVIAAGSEIIAKPYHIEDLANRLREMMKRER